MLNYEEQKVYVANAGDSRCIMGKGGQVVPMSFDHKPECETEVARIEAAVAGAEDEDLEEFTPSKPLAADLAIGLPSDI